MTFKWFVIVTSTLLAGFGVAIAHAQTRAPQSAPAAPSGLTITPTSTTAAAPTTSTSASTPMPSSAAVPVGGFPLSTDYVIGPDDLLMITVWKNEALSRTLPVRPDGKISLPLLYDVQAAGLTAMQLRDKLASAFGEFMPNPEVSVSVMEVRSYRVSVLGEVQKPGVLQLKSDTTVLEAIALAGGFRDFASPGKITILRKDNHGATQKIRFNYNRVVKNGEDNVTLKSGDVVLVP